MIRVMRVAVLAVAVVVVVVMFLKVFVAVLIAHLERDLILLIRAVIEHQMNVIIIVMARLTVIITVIFNVVVVVVIVVLVIVIADAVAHVNRFVSAVADVGFRAGTIRQISQVADDLIVGDRRRNWRVGQRVGTRRVGQTLSYRLYHCIERAAQRMRLLAEKTRIDCVWLIGFDRNALRHM